MRFSHSGPDMDTSSMSIIRKMSATYANSYLSSGHTSQTYRFIRNLGIISRDLTSRIHACRFLREPPAASRPVLVLLPTMCACKASGSFCDRAIAIAQSRPRIWVGFELGGDRKAVVQLAQHVWVSLFTHLHPHPARHPVQPEC